VYGLMWLSVEVEVVDGRHGPRPEDLVLHHFGVERLGVMDQAGARPGELGLAEETAEAVHTERRNDHHQQNHQQYPNALGDTHHRTVTPRRSLPIYALF